MHIAIFSPAVIETVIKGLINKTMKEVQGMEKTTTTLINRNAKLSIRMLGKKKHKQSSAKPPASHEVRINCNSEIQKNNESVYKISHIACMLYKWWTLNSGLSLSES